uniref:Aldose 1-epimerase n=1 Tax=Thermomicrobium roseum TaxID=500 RepID=A0A7C5VUW6_THERO
MGLGRYRRSRNWGCRAYQYRVQDLDLIVLENQLLRIGILAGRGADIVEFLYKPCDLDFVWLHPQGIRNPATYLSTSPDTLATFLDAYPGGWQEILPNGGAPCSVLGAQFGLHGEVAQLPWDYDLVEDSEKAITLRLDVETQKFPLRLSKYLHLANNHAVLEISELLTNQSPADIPVMWGHHLAFGKPAIGEGSRIILPNSVTVIPHPQPISRSGRRLRGDLTGTWPIVESADRGHVDLQQLPPAGTPSELVYLTNFRSGWYEITTPDQQLALRVEWDARRFPYLWFWQEFGASKDYPWFGRIYVVGLEPFSSYPDDGLASAIANGSALWLRPYQSYELTLRLEVRQLASS